MKQLIVTILLLLITMIRVADAKWAYDAIVDPLDDSVSYIISTGTIDGDPGLLLVGFNNGNGNLWISVDLGTYIGRGTSDYGLIDVQWRFDKRKTHDNMWWSNNKGTGGSLKTSSSVSAFLQDMKECNTLVIRFTGYDGSTETRRFSLMGFTLNYNKYIGKFVIPSIPSE